MSNIDKRALREAAEKATTGRWEYYPGNTSIEYNVDSMDEDQGSIVYVDSGDFTQKQTDLNGTYIAAANPATVLAMLDELEAAESGVAELNDALCKLLPGCQYMDPPDGGSVTPLEQVTRMVADYRERMEVAEKRIAELEGELEVSQHDLSDTEDAMHIWAERAKKAEGKSLICSPIAYAPSGHISRYLNGSNSGCWVYGSPTGEDDDALYMAAPNNVQHFDRNTICEKVHSKCSRIPGATFYNAAEFALDEVEHTSAAGKGE